MTASLDRAVEAALRAMCVCEPDGGWAEPEVRVRRGLTAAIPHLGVDREWLPIDSCPNVSEQRILLAWPDGTVEQGMWLKNPTWEGYRPESLRPWPKGRPSHWMPMPAIHLIETNQEPGHAR